MHVNHISQLEIVIADFLVLALTQCSHSGCTVTSGVEQEISTMNKELLEIQETMASLKKVWVLCSLLPNKSLELSFSADMLDCRSCMADLATQSIWRSSAGQTWLPTEDPQECAINDTLCEGLDICHEYVSCSILGLAHSGAT